MTNRLIALLFLGTALSACAAQETTRSGFMTDYSQLQQSAEGDLRFSARPTAAYNAFLVDDVAYMPNGKSAPLTTTEIDALRAHHKAAAEAAFAETFQKAAAPAPGVMRIRLAITGVDKADTTLNYVSTLLVGPLSNGGASSEGEVVDSISGARLAALSTHTNATPFKGGLFGYYSELGHAKAVLERHVAQLRDVVVQSAR